MIPKYAHAIVKFNGGRGALLCNRCGTIVREGIRHADVEHYCDDCAAVRGSGDFLKDTGHENPDEMREKLALVNAIACAIKDCGIADAAAAAMAGISASDIDRIRRGLVDHWSADELERVLRALT